MVVIIMEIDDNNIEYMKENAQSLKEALFRFDDLMKQLDVTYVLVWGSLLGAYRNGCLLPWDHDIDFMIPVGDNDLYTSFDDFDAFKILRAATECGFSSAGFGHSFNIDKNFIKDPNVAALPNNEQWKAFIKTDPDWKKEKFAMIWKGSYLTDNVLECFLAIEGIHPVYSQYSSGKLGKIKLYGRDFYTPCDIERHLDMQYGFTWKNVFVNNDLWTQYVRSIDKGEIPEEVFKFMEDVKSANILVKY